MKDMNLMSLDIIKFVTYHNFISGAKPEVIIDSNKVNSHYLMICPKIKLQKWLDIKAIESK